MVTILILTDRPRSLVDRCGPLLVQMSREGHRPVVVGPEPPLEMPAEGVEYHSITVDDRRETPRRLCRTMTMVQEALQRWTPDLLIGDGPEATARGLVCCWSAGKAVAYAMLTDSRTSHSSTPTIHHYLVQTVASRLYRLGDITGESTLRQASDEVYLRCARRLVGEADRITRIDPSAVDLEKYRCTSLPEKASFLFVGDLVRSSGVIEYARAARRVVTHHPSAKFMLAGWPDTGTDGVDVRRLRAWIEDGVVEYLGHLDDVQEAIGDAAVYVTPSHIPRTSSTELKAMAMGRPLIATQFAGHRQTVCHGENGFVVEPNAVEPLEWSMRHFIGDPGLRETMGANSRKRAVTDFSACRITDNLLDVLELPRAKVQPPPLPTAEQPS